MAASSTRSREFSPMNFYDPGIPGTRPFVSALNRRLDKSVAGYHLHLAGTLPGLARFDASNPSPGSGCGQQFRQFH